MDQREKLKSFSINITKF